MIGVPGSLFQKCSSFLEASLRLAQAWMIGGIVYRIPQSVLLPGTTDTWLQAFACSPMPALLIPQSAMPRLNPVPPCSSSEAPDPVLDAEVMGSWWQTFLPGCKATRDYTPTTRAVFAPCDSPPSPSSTSSWDSGLVSPSSPPTDWETVVLPRNPPTSACGDTDEGNALPLGIRSFPSSSFRAPTRPEQGGYVVIVCGEAPWLFPAG